jgi:hypothetical protein
LGKYILEVQARCRDLRLAGFRIVLFVWCRCSGFLLSPSLGLLHAHCASGFSFWRKLLFISPALSVRKFVVLRWQGDGFAYFSQFSNQLQGQKIV